MNEAAADNGQGRPSALDHLRSKKKPATSRVTLCLDPEAADAWDAAQRAEQQAQATYDDEPGETTRATLTVAQRATQAAREAVEAASQEFRFQSIGRDRYEAMLDDHPATDETRAKQTAGGQIATDYHPRTFPIALIAASLTMPALTDDEVAALWDDPNWTGNELSILWSHAMLVNGQSRVVDLKKGSGSTRP